MTFSGWSGVIICAGDMVVFEWEKHSHSISFNAKNRTLPQAGRKIISHTPQKVKRKNTQILHKNKHPDLYTLTIDTGQSICYNTGRKNEGRTKK
jgi:plastocyanin